MYKIDPQSWKDDIPLFKEKSQAFQAGEMKVPEYKGFSGRYGSYAQRGKVKNMLRLRMPAGRVTADKLAFTANAIRKYHIDTAHFTTCQTIQLHNLEAADAAAIMEKALDVGIVTIGGGGDYPRNTMCSPLTGVEKGEYFDVLPWAEAAGEYAMNFINAPKMPRKLKIAFSNSPENIPHATYRDLGFVARPDGKFDVYSAGGLGNNPKMGVKVDEAVDPEEIFYYIQAMWITFRTYGNYQNRGKARTRYMQDVCGGAENYKKAYVEKLKEVYESGEELEVNVKPIVFSKTGNGSSIVDKNVIEQKQEGLYAVKWHPIGGTPNVETLCNLSNYIDTLTDVEMRLSPDETAYIINLNGDEAREVLKIIDADNAKTEFETSVSCIGASICQAGLRDSQALLKACVKAVRENAIPDGALPVIHISGCPSSCGTHQTGEIGFRGAAKNKQNAFMLYHEGTHKQGREKMGTELGAIYETDIPAFLVELGQTVASSGKTYTEWNKENPHAFKALAEKYIVK